MLPAAKAALLPLHTALQFLTLMNVPTAWQIPMAGHAALGCASVEGRQPQVVHLPGPWIKLEKSTQESFQPDNVEIK
jgi:hypothetical protein